MNLLDLLPILRKTASYHSHDEYQARLGPARLVVERPNSGTQYSYPCYECGRDATTRVEFWLLNRGLVVECRVDILERIAPKNGARKA